MAALRFDITGRSPSCAARVGVVQTLHGSFDTPAFMPVGTKASVKGLLPELVRRTGSQVILGNTYHLMLRPGSDVVASFGGLHRFMRWDGPILTDSGGYQVFSMSDISRITDDGVVFRSIIDGSTVKLTPQRSMQVQNELGADIIMAFDDCPPSADEAKTQAGAEEARDPLASSHQSHHRATGTAHAARLEIALERTIRWLERCAAAHRRPDEQALFGIVQGGIFPDLRRESAATLCAMDFPGYAIGGLSVGETKEQMYAALDITVPALPADKPRYLMGVGAPEDVVEGVARGIDIFDCVLPTRVARNGGLLTRGGRMNLRNARYAADPLPVEPGCGCYTCQHFSRAYLRHLFKSEEILGLHLATVHNIHFMLRLMDDIRAHIAAGTFAAFRQAFLAGYQLPDQEVRHAQRAARQARRQAGR